MRIADLLYLTTYGKEYQKLTQAVGVASQAYVAAAVQIRAEGGTLDAQSEKRRQSPEYRVALDAVLCRDAFRRSIGLGPFVGMPENMRR